jgi:hypothetical protein
MGAFRMEIAFLLQMIALGIIIYSGLFVGKMLSMIAPEEIRPGKKNLIFLQKILFFIVLMSFAFTISSYIWKIIITLIIIYALFKIQNSSLHNNNYYIIYTFIGIFLGIASKSPLLIFPAFTSFLIGMPTASLNSTKPLKVYAKLFLVMFCSMIVSLLVFN